MKIWIFLQFPGKYFRTQKYWFGTKIVHRTFGNSDFAYYHYLWSWIGFGWQFFFFGIQIMIFSGSGSATLIDISFCTNHPNFQFDQWFGLDRTCFGRLAVIMLASSLFIMFLDIKIRVMDPVVFARLSDPGFLEGRIHKHHMDSQTCFDLFWEYIQGRHDKSGLKEFLSHTLKNKVMSLLFFCFTWK